MAQARIQMGQENGLSLFSQMHPIFLKSSAHSVANLMSSGMICCCTEGDDVDVGIGGVGVGGDVVVGGGGGGLASFSYFS